MSAAQVSRLKENVDRVAQLIFQCEQALAIYDAIGDKSVQINQRKLGNFFGPVQNAFFKSLGLDVCKIFEKPKRNHIYSIPATIQLLNSYTLKQREPLVRVISDRAVQPSGSSDDDLVKAYLEEITKKIDSDDMVNKIETFRTVRDKWIAHDEACVMKPSINYHDATFLLAFAKGFVSTVGLAFVGASYSDDRGEFDLDSYARRASSAVGRILEHMGIVALRGMHDDVRACMLTKTIQRAEWSETVKEQVRQSF